MNEFIYFIDKFVKRERQNRWRGFAGGKWEQLAEKLGDLERSLNEQCTLVESNAFSTAAKILAERKIHRGIYIDYFNSSRLMDPIDLGKISDDSLLICQDKKLAFYFHHENWVWICEERVNPR
ncbi:hypothetical protein GCM10027093_01730 [Paraburkholderia jirisanensis]